MKQTLGFGASTCSYVDWLKADLLVFFGSNVANNQPVTTKYIHHAKQNGAQVAVVNTFREPGLERYWVPSIPSSALFGTEIADHWFQVHTGGDLAFLIGVFRALVDSGGVDVEFVRDRTNGFEEASARATATAWEDLERESGATRSQMQAFARLLVERPNSIFVWSMGLTQHAHGVETIKALVNVGLARGLPGRPNRGLVPIRGHSGVQGGAEVGCVPGVDAATRLRWADVWGFDPPSTPGWTTAEMIEHAADGDVDAFWIVGGNFLETLRRTKHAHDTRWPVRDSASIRTSCCPRRCWWTAKATSCCCRRSRVTNRKAAGRRRPPNVGSFSRRRLPAGGSAQRGPSGRSSAT